MASYLIYTDAAADIPAHVFQKYDLRIVPMRYTLNGKEILFNTASPDHDRLCDEFFEALKKGGDAMTSQITQFDFMEIFEPDLKDGNDILYLCFSSGISGTYNNACLAAEELNEKYPESRLLVVDTMAATQGQGVFTHTALINREKGMSMEENAAWLLEKRPYLCHRFVVGDLHHLHKGGRVSSTAAVVGTMLQVKPLLIIDDEGKLDVVEKARGMKRAQRRLVEAYQKEQGVPDVPKLVYVGHTSLYKEVEALCEAIRAVAEEGTVVEPVNLGPIIATHVGPEFFSVCGWGFHRREA